MAIRQYIGARYVPRFRDSFDPTQEYETLDVVDNGGGTSYIARKPVPVGTPLNNSEYWALYGSTSGAVIALQNQVNGMQTQMNGMSTDLDSIKGAYATVESFGAVGDGITDDTAAIQAAIDSDIPVIVFTKDYLVKTDTQNAPLTDGQDPSYCAIKADRPKTLIFNGAHVKGYHSLGTGDAGSDAYFICAMDAIEIIGLDYDGQHPTYHYQYCVQFNASNCIMRDCNIRNLGGSVAVFNGSSSSRIENICVDNVHTNNNGNTMFFAWCDNVFINNVTMINVSEGFDFDKYSTNVVINGINVSTVRGSGADAAIEINGGKRFTISNVNCYNFNDGILLNGKTVDGVNYTTEDVSISDCIFDTIVGYGLVCGNSLGADTMEVKHVSISNMRVKNATLAGYEIVGADISLVNCAAENCGYQAVYIATKARDISIDRFYSYGNARGFINCSICTGLLTLSNIYESEAANTNDHGNVLTGISNLIINGLKVMHDSSFSASNNTMYNIVADNAWIDGFITSGLATALVKITAGRTNSTFCKITNSSFNDGVINRNMPNIYYTTLDFSSIPASEIFHTGDILICRPSSAGTTMHICSKGNNVSGSCEWKTVSLS